MSTGAFSRTPALEKWGSTLQSSCLYSKCFHHWATLPQCCLTVPCLYRKCVSSTYSSTGEIPKTDVWAAFRYRQIGQGWGEGSVVKVLAAQTKLGIWILRIHGRARLVCWPTVIPSLEFENWGSPEQACSWNTASKSKVEEWPWKIPDISVGHVCVCKCVHTHMHMKKRK